jgi:predicted glycogen debranching enzyme
MLENLENGLFPNTGKKNTATYNTADASLWFIWALQQYAMHTKTLSKIWDEYGSHIKSVLENYRSGTLHHIHMLENNLIYAGEPGVAVTWMDAIVDGKPVTPRIGMAVELNALWYNAIRFALEVAAFGKDKKFISEWESLPIQIETSFEKTFWNEEKKYLADVVNDSFTDWSLRPNQVIAASLPYTPIRDEIKKSILKTVKEKLLTPRGLRTLSPDDANYKGVCFGSQRERDLAYHQGTVWPWLLGHFAEAYMKTFEESAMPFIQSIYENFAPAVLEYGIGTIAEIYDGDEPHKARGTISQAWSVAELLRIRSMMSANHNGELKKIKKPALQILL